MGLQFRTSLRNLMLNQIEIDGGTSPTLEIRTGSPPANCAASDSGTAVAILTLPSDWMAAAGAGVKAMTGSWTGTASGGAAATPTHFRIKAGATCHLQGTAGIGSGECQVNGTITSGQTVTVSSFQITAANT